MRIWLAILTVASIAEAATGATPPRQRGDTPRVAGTVYFYYDGYEMPQGMFGPVPSIAVLVDGVIVATMRQRTYVGVRVTAGRHAFATKSRRTNPKETTIEMDIAPGQQVFIRLDMLIAGLGIVKWTAFPRIVDKDEGRVMVAALQPLDARNVEDKSRVTMEPPTPATKATPDGNSVLAELSFPLPEESGIYVISASALQRLAPEVTIFRTTSVYGVTANLKSPRSATRLKAPLEFVIRCAEGTTVAEYVLVQLMRKGDRREYRTLDGGKAWMRQGPERMAVPFESRRVGPNIHYVRIIAVPKGEYGWVPPGAGFSASAASTTNTFTFGID